MLSSEEILLLTSAIETYGEENRYFLKPDVQNRLVKSTLSKLSNYSCFTYFTKQDFKIF